MASNDQIAKAIDTSIDGAVQILNADFISLKWIDFLKLF